MSELQSVGPARQSGPQATPVFAPNLVAPIRTFSTSLIGFAELLEDRELNLSDARRLEYENILMAAGAALEAHIRASLAADGDAA